MWHYEVKEREQFPGFLKQTARLLSRGMAPIAMLTHVCPRWPARARGAACHRGEEAAGVPVCV